MESRNVSFFETLFPFLTKDNESSSRLDDEVFQNERQHDDEVFQNESQYEEEEVVPRRNKGQELKSLLNDFISFVIKSEPNTY